MAKNTKNVTMLDVANEAQVSRALVSLAYRNAYGVNADTRDKIFAAGKKLGYHPNRVAAQLAGKSPNTIGIYLQDLRNDWFAEVYEGIREVLEPAGKHLVLTVGAIDGSRDAEALDSLFESRVDLVIVAGLMMPEKQFLKYAKQLPVVSVARIVPGVDNVYSDNQLGAATAVDHLVELGHRNIAFVANPITEGYGDRREGYQTRMRHHGLEPTVIEATYSRSATEKIVGELLDSANAPSAIFAHNDQAALGALDAAVVRGLRPGSDISIIGYDNNSLSRTPLASLTTIDSHGKELGRLAAKAALSRLENPNQPAVKNLIDPTLVIRKSTGRPA